MDLQLKKMPQCCYIEIIKNMYEGAVTSVRSASGISSYTKITSRVYFESLSFTLIMNEQTRELTDEIS